jgi:hypothetical protein
MSEALPTYEEPTLWDLSSATSSPASDLIPCRDGKARRVESGTFPLAHGVPGRVGLLRGYGNAIVPQVAAEFIHGHLIRNSMERMEPSDWQKAAELWQKCAERRLTEIQQIEAAAEAQVAKLENVIYRRKNESGKVESRLL